MYKRQGQVSRDQIGRDVFQEADITGAAEPFTKYSWLVKDPTQIPRIMKEAFYIASSGRPGPVLIDIPIDVQDVYKRQVLTRAPSFMLMKCSDSSPLAVSRSTPSAPVLRLTENLSRDVYKRQPPRRTP